MFLYDLLEYSTVAVRAYKTSLITCFLLLAYLLVYLLSFLLTCLLAYMHTYFLAYLLACLPLPVRGSRFCGCAKSAPPLKNQ